MPHFQVQIQDCRICFICISLAWVSVVSDASIPGHLLFSRVVLTVGLIVPSGPKTDQNLFRLPCSILQICTVSSIQVLKNTSCVFLPSKHGFQIKFAHYFLLRCARVIVTQGRAVNLEMVHKLLDLGVVCQHPHPCGAIFYHNPARPPDPLLRVSRGIKN